MGYFVFEFQVLKFQFRFLGGYLLDLVEGANPFGRVLVGSITHR